MILAARTMLCLSAALAMAGCSQTSRMLRLDTVDIGESAELILPTRDEMRSYLDATQLISGMFEGRDYTLQVQIEWRPGSMAMAALGVWGTAVFSLTYDGTDLEVQGNPRLLQGLRAEYMLADFLLTFWDESRLRTNLRGENLSVVDTPLHRSIEQGGKPLISIAYENEDAWSGHVRYEHMNRGYVLEIETLQHSGS